MKENILQHAIPILDQLNSIPLINDLKDQAVVSKCLDEFSIASTLNSNLSAMYRSNLKLKNLYEGEPITAQATTIIKPKGPKNKNLTAYILEPVPGSETKYPEEFNTLNEVIASLYGGKEQLEKLDRVSYSIDHLPKDNVWYITTQHNGFIPIEVGKHLTSKSGIVLNNVSAPTAPICSDGRPAQILLVPSKTIKSHKKELEDAAAASGAGSNDDDEGSGGSDGGGEDDAGVSKEAGQSLQDEVDQMLAEGTTVESLPQPMETTS